MSIKDTSRCMGYQQVTSLSSAATLTIPSDAVDSNIKPTLCLLQAEGQSIRWRDDGTAPTASVGMILNVGDAPYPYDGNLASLQFIQTAATAKLNVSYYR